MSEDDSVGYKKPPKHSQFKKGQSGYPGGRRKKKPELPNLEKILMETLMDPVTVTEHGKTRQITKMAAMFKQLINKAANGNMPSIKLAVLLLERMPQVANAEAEAEDRAKVLAQVREKVRRRLDNMSKAFEEETAREAMKGQGRDDQIIGGAGNQGSVSN